MPLPSNAAVVVEARGRYCFSNIRRLAAAAAIGQGAGGNSGWVNLAMAGRWEGHPAGAFEFSPQVFSQMIENFNKAKTPVKFDYEHQSMNGQAGPKPASGHIKKLETRDNGQTLWAFVDWTPKAAEMIRGGEYNFCSPVVAFQSVNRKTGQQQGAELLQCALTDDPFLDGQQPIQLSYTAASAMNQEDCKPMGDMPPMLPPPPVAPMADPMMVPPPEVATMADSVPPPPPTVEGNLPPEEEQPPTELADQTLPPDGGEADGNALLTQLAEASGSDRAGVLAAITDHLDEVIAIVQKAAAKSGTPAEMRQMSKTPVDEAAEKARRIAAIEASQKDAQIVALTKKLEELSAAVTKVTEAEEARAKAAIEAKVDELIKSGHVEQVGRDNAIWAFTNAPERAAVMFSRQIVPINTPQSATPDPKVGGTGGSETPVVGPDGKVNVVALSKSQAARFTALMDRYNGDEAKATKMFSKLYANEQKGSVH